MRQFNDGETRKFLEQKFAELDRKNKLEKMKNEGQSGGLFDAGAENGGTGVENGAFGVGGSGVVGVRSTGNDGMGNSAGGINSGGFSGAGMNAGLGIGNNVEAVGLYGGNGKYNMNGVSGFAGDGGLRSNIQPARSVVFNQEPNAFEKTVENWHNPKNVNFSSAAYKGGVKPQLDQEDNSVVFRNQYNPFAAVVDGIIGRFGGNKAYNYMNVEDDYNQSKIPSKEQIQTPIRGDEQIQTPLKLVAKKNYDNYLKVGEIYPGVKAEWKKTLEEKPLYYNRNSNHFADPYSRGNPRDKAIEQARFD